MGWQNRQNVCAEPIHSCFAGCKASQTCLEDRGASPSSVFICSPRRSFTAYLTFEILLQPTSPEVPRSAVALSETGAVVAWPSLGDAKGPQKKKQSLSAPVTPSKKVPAPINTYPYMSAPRLTLAKVDSKSCRRISRLVLRCRQAADTCHCISTRDTQDHMRVQPQRLRAGQSICSPPYSCTHEWMSSSTCPPCLAVNSSAWVAGSPEDA